MENKKTLTLLGLGLALGLSLSLAFRTASAEPSNITGELEQTRDRFQAAQWLRLAREFFETGDYPQSGHFCNLILTYYPDTTYAQMAEKLLKKTSSPGENRSREFRRNNPGLFFVQ